MKRLTDEYSEDNSNSDRRSCDEIVDCGKKERKFPPGCMHVYVWAVAKWTATSARKQNWLHILGPAEFQISV